jgi:hypothetical protein
MFEENCNAKKIPMSGTQKNSRVSFFNLKVLALVFSLAVVFLFRPAGVFASGQGSYCNASNPGVCDSGFACQTTNSAVGYNTCVPIPTTATTCSASAVDPCMTSVSGLTCQAGTCKVAQGTAPLPSQCQLQGLTGSNCCSAYPTDPVCLGVVPSTIPATQGGCPTGLNSVNGLCLPPNNTACTNGVCASNSLTDLLIKIITLLLSVAGIIAVLMLIVGGFWYITSAGNEEQAEKGRKAIINSIIGVIVVLLSYAIITVISNVITKGT